jgi:hypothetical protein
MAVEIGMPMDKDYWGDYNKIIMDHCSKQLRLEIPGYSASAGMVDEKIYHEESGKTVYTLDGEDCLNILHNHYLDE